MIAAVCLDLSLSSCCCCTAAADVCVYVPRLSLSRDACRCIAESEDEHGLAGHRVNKLLGRQRQTSCARKM
jgi:hypothetical protein